MNVRPLTCSIFVGRREELGMLNDARRALAQSRGQIVLIAGDAGIGKSRLLAQFVRAAGEGRARNVAIAECLEAAQRPYGPIRDWVASLRPKLREAAMAPDVRSALEHLAPHAPGAALADGRTLEKADIFAALAAFLRAIAAERATVLTVEDLHWADPSTLELLAFLSSRIGGTRLLIVATYRADQIERNEALAGAVARMTRDASVRRLTLPSLSPSEIDELLASALEGHASPPAETLQDIARQSEGNPFFAEELLKGAIERPSSNAPEGLPLSIRAGILERLASLTEDERSVIASAAVLGYRFEPRVLALTMNRSVDSLLPALRRARNLNVVLEEDSPEGSFRFRHALTRQTIYADMLQFDARRVHERILTTLEALDEAARPLDQLAYHAWVARNVPKTLTYNARAGEAALEMHGIPEARTYFERALGAASAVGDRARLFERVGHVAQLQGRSEDALAAYEAALVLRRESRDYDDAADLVRSIVVERNNVSDPGAMQLGESFLAEHGEKLSRAPRNALVAIMARLASARYDFDAVEGYLAQIDVRESLPPRALQNCLIAEMELRAYLGDAAGWLVAAQRANELLADLPAFNAAILSYTIAQAGTFLGANQIVERALARAERAEQRWDFGALSAFGCAVRAAYWFQRGQLSVARTCIEGALARPDAFIALAAAATVAPLIALGLGDEALGRRSVADAVLRDSRQGEVSADDALTLSVHAAWLANTGHLDQARTDARRALFALRRPLPLSGIVLAVAAELLAPEELARAESLFDVSRLREDDVVGRANAALGSAIRARRFGPPAHAASFGRSAAATFRELGWPLMEARALEAAGDVTAATALFEKCGAAGDMRRLRPNESLLNDNLSPRERAVADLVADGLSNAAIAARLAVSGKTVEKHVASLFVKLGVRSRAQIASAITRAGAATQKGR